MSEPARLRAPVISVGNIAMGGRGKTPVTMLIARLLVEAGERPAILSRGYKRARPDDGVTIVSDGSRILADLDRSGDEPLMMAEQVPGAAVLVCDVRAIAGALAERALGATVHILDDGFQHASLARDIDIVLVTPEDLQGRRMPFGRLRSPVSALARADAVVTDNLGVAFDGHPQPPRRFRLDRMLGAPVAVERDGRLPSARTSVVAVAGIAQPERFETSLVRAGWQIARFMTFPDHHVFTKADVERIAAAAREVGAEVVLTTDKDAMRLRALAPLPVTFAAVPLAVTIQPLATDEGSFEGWLLERLRCVRRARA